MPHWGGRAARTLARYWTNQTADLLTVLDFREIDTGFDPQSLGIVEIRTPKDRIHESNTSRAGGSTMLRLWGSHPESIYRKVSTVPEYVVRFAQLVVDVLAERPLLARQLASIFIFKCFAAAVKH